MMLKTPIILILRMVALVIVMVILDFEHVCHSPTARSVIDKMKNAASNQGTATDGCAVCEM